MKNKSANSQLLSEWMREKKVSGNRAAELLDLSSGVISRLINGRSRFTPEICLRLHYAKVADFFLLSANQAAEDKPRLEYELDLSCVRRI